MRVKDCSAGSNTWCKDASEAGYAMPSASDPTGCVSCALAGTVAVLIAVSLAAVLLAAFALAALRRFARKYPRLFQNVLSVACIAYYYVSSISMISTFEVVWPPAFGLMADMLSIEKLAFLPKPECHIQSEDLPVILALVQAAVLLFVWMLFAPLAWKSKPSENKSS